MMTRTLGALLAAAVVASLAVPAEAYVGPGAGLSLVGAFWGLMVAVFAALAFMIVWPIRRLLRRGKAKPAAARSSGTAEAQASGSDSPVA